MERATSRPAIVKSGVSSGWRIALGLIISAVCIGVLFWQIDWRQTMIALVGADAKLLVLAALLLVGCYFAFAIRWWLLLRRDPSLPLYRLFAVLMMGLAANVTLPLRPGDALRVYLVGHVYGGGVARTLGSILLERILDVACVVALGGMVALYVRLPNTISGVLVGVSVFVGAVLIVVVLLEVFAGPLTSSLRRKGAESARRWTRVVAGQLMAATEILTAGGSLAILMVATIVGAIGWTLYGAAMIACVAALGAGGAIVSGGLLLVVLTNLGGIIPSSPGSIGIYHALAVLALTVTGTSQELALAVAFVSHALIVIVQLFLGLLGFGSLNSAVRSSIVIKRGLG